MNETEYRPVVVQHDYTNNLSLGLHTVMPDGFRFADLVFADPPYNLGIGYADDETRDRLPDDKYRSLCLHAMSQLEATARPGATFWWMTDERHADWTGQMLTEHVGPRLYRIVWEESFSQYQGDRALTKDYRFIFVHVVRSAVDNADDWGKDLVTWNPNDIRVPSVRQQMGDKRANPNGRVPGCVWKFRRLQGTSRARVDWHKAQLPPELLTRIVRGWTNPGDTVVDGFGGSGSMGRVCRTLGRHSVLIDKSPTYVRKMREELSA